MNFYISKIILWPKEISLGPRELNFELGKINIISGESSTGKSSITWIIDYCLCSSKCSIPVGLIRQVTAWYGLLLKFSDGKEMLIARREPGEQQSTDDMYWQVGTSLEIPIAIVEKNINKNDVKKYFNYIYNIPHEQFDCSYLLKNTYPSFRDMAAFNFQPQHIVANPYTLFFKADTTEHREKLKVIFPLILGAMTSDILIKQHKLKDLEKEFAKKNEIYNLKKQAVDSWLSGVKTYYIEAQEFGIIPNYIENRTDWDVEKYKNELTKIKDFVSSKDLPIIAPGASEKFISELQQVIEEEDKVSQQIGELRRRLSKLTELKNAVDTYTTRLNQQTNRVLSINWLTERLKEEKICPFCKAKHDDTLPEIQKLHEISNEFANITRGIQQTPKSLESTLIEASKELREKEEYISKIRKQRQQLEVESSEQAKHRQRIRNIYKFVGKLEQAIEEVNHLSKVDDAELSYLKNEIDVLKKELDPSLLKKQIEDTLKTVSILIRRYAECLKLEHLRNEISLDIKELTVAFKSPLGKIDYLWEVGSGQNWLGYHIATLLAIHQHIASNGENFVPSFLVIDQPSQVYFPESLNDGNIKTEKGNATKTPSDVDAVRRIFSTISKFMDQMGLSFQIIITEHAGSFAWEGISNINLVEEWRSENQNALIPTTWLR
ncbi:MAG: DUF3732 domain-containing protein [Opitutales bacterium]|nr:DUF3732 domain-containing protein [Opitutales bacterium]